MTAQAFTSLSLISLLVTPLTTLIQSVPSLAAAAGCLKRIQAFLTDATGADKRNLLSSASSNSLEASLSPETKNKGLALEMGELMKSKVTESKIIIECRDASFGWTTAPVLKNISLEIRRSALTIITGPVGCGKSTFIKGILGELPEMSGYVAVDSVCIAYCDQSPWLLNESIRQNVISASKFEHEWYNTVIRACALDRDIAELPGRDETAVGSKGLTLSGGQKQRIVSHPILSNRSVVYSGRHNDSRLTYIGDC